ncbi:RNA 2',3'-cyclic 3'-phosphodiesterase [Desulfarculales bacterium]
MRLFVALELPPEVKQAASTVTVQLRLAGANVKWVATQKLHLTLKFLGEVAPEKLPGLKQAPSQALAGHKPLDLTVRGLSTPFPRSSASRCGLAGPDRAGDRSGRGP